MLYKGYAEAVKNIRLREELTQKDTAERVRAAGLANAKFNHRSWSKYETGAKKFGAADLPIVLAGLGCIETELWQETVRTQSTHYYRRTDEVGEEAPKYGTAMAAGILQGLWALKIELLPAEEQGWFRQQRTALAESLSAMFSAIDVFKERYWRLLAKKIAEDDDEDR